MTPTLNIACLTGRYPAQSERFLQRDLTALHQAGHAIHIWPVLEGPRSGRARWHLPNGKPLPPVPGRTEMNASVATAFRALAGCGLLQLRRLPGFLRQLDLLPARPDLILAGFGNLPAVYGRALSAALEIPLVVLFHARDVWRPYRPGLRAAATAKAIVTCSHAAGDALQPLLPHARQVMHTIPHYLPADPFPDLPEPQDPPTILAAGRFVPKKGFALLLKAFHLLLPTLPAVRLQLIGEGPEEHSLRKLRSTLRLTPEQARIRRWLAPSDLREEMGKAAVVVQPSIIAPDGDRDGIPNILLEAMALGRPVVGTGAGAIPEVIIDNQTGLLAQAGNPDSLFQCLLKCLTDRERAEALGKAGREHVHKAHCAESSWQKLEALLLRTAGPKIPATP